MRQVRIRHFDPFGVAQGGLREKSRGVHALTREPLTEHAMPRAATTGGNDNRRVGFGEFISIVGRAYQAYTYTDAPDCLRRDL